MVPEGFMSTKRKSPKAPAKRPAKPAKAAPPTKEGRAPPKPAKGIVDPARGARPVHVPTAALRQKVQQFAGLGNSVASIAAMLEMSTETVDRYYSEDIALGVARANTNVAAALYGRAIKGDVNAQKFFLGSRAGWKPGIVAGGDGLTIHISADDAAL